MLTKRNLLLHLELLLFLLYLASFNQACNPLDQDALLSLNFKTSSASLNWFSAIDCCLWEGIKCDVNDHVTHLWLPRRDIGGKISPYIGKLTHLSHLNLSHNRLSGALHNSSIAILVQLETLDLSHNYLSGEFPLFLSSNYIKLVDLLSNYFHGTIPSSFFLLSYNLISFNISNNSFTGLIPSFSRIDHACLVSHLDFSFNDFSGQLPPELGNCSKLQTFRAGFNNLSGLLPDDIYSATSLVELSVPFNHLSGSISNRIIQLRNLTILELYYNHFTGLIPTDIGELTNLKHLNLFLNNLSGSLLSSMENCINLVKLILTVNNFEGNLSAFNFSKLLQLRTLDLGHNNFTGSFPLTLTSCKSLTGLRLGDNHLEGNIPSQTVALASLSYLSLSGNKLTNITSAIMILMGCKNLSILFMDANVIHEAMPDNEHIKFSEGFQNLRALSLANSLLHSGQVPKWIGKLRKLELLDLSGNLISGPIPGWLGNFPSLFHIDLSSNLFSGEFPKELCGLPLMASEEAQNQLDKSYLELSIYTKFPSNPSTYVQFNILSNIPAALYLQNSYLSGNIPTDVGKLKFLHVLDLSQNNLSGNIPNQMSQLTNLKGLDLSGNHLSGEIPDSLRDLHFLSSFSAADNNLQGQIPTGGQFDTFPSSSYDGNPGLCGSIVQRSCTTQPSTTVLSERKESSKKELHFGLMAGGTFGLIIGCTCGILLPLHRLNFLQNYWLWQVPFLRGRCD